jgi:hypothetical protein
MLHHVGHDDPVKFSVAGVGQNIPAQIPQPLTLPIGGARDAYCVGGIVYARRVCAHLIITVRQFAASAPNIKDGFSAYVPRQGNHALQPRIQLLSAAFKEILIAPAVV